MKHYSDNFKTTIFLGIASFVTSGINYITTPIFTRLLTTSEYGLISKYNSVYLIVSVIATLTLSLYLCRGKEFTKKVNYMILAVSLIIIALIILYRTGHLSRYEEFFQKFGQKDIHQSDYSGGRFALWEKAWSLFKSNPFFGIGWEQFMTLNKYNHDVHNTYLQWLCETGIVGFVLLFTPFVRLFGMSFCHLKKMIRQREGQPDVLSFGVVGFGLQLFFLIVNFVDPAFFHLNFFCFFCITIILSESAYRLFRQNVINNSCYLPRCA